MTEGTQHEHKHPWITSSDHTTQVSTALSQLLWLTLRSFFADFARLTGLKLLIVAFAFVPAIFLNALVTQMAEENSSPSSSLEYAIEVPKGLVPSLIIVGSLGVLLICSAVVYTRYQYNANVVQVKVKGAMSSMLYAKFCPCLSKLATI